GGHRPHHRRDRKRMMVRDDQVAASLDEAIAGRTHSHWLARLASEQTFWVSLAAVVAFVVLALASDVFATQQNLFNVTRNFPFVVTLGMLSIARSLAMVLSGNRMVYEFGPDQPKLLAMGGGFLELAAIRIPNPVLVLLVLLLIAAFAFRWTRWGRHIFAIGGN